MDTDKDAGASGLSGEDQMAGVNHKQKDTQKSPLIWRLRFRLVGSTMPGLSCRLGSRCRHSLLRKLG